MLKALEHHQNWFSVEQKQNKNILNLCFPSVSKYQRDESHAVPFVVMPAACLKYAFSKFLNLQS